MKAMAPDRTTFERWWVHEIATTEDLGGAASFCFWGGPDLWGVGEVGAIWRGSVILTSISCQDQDMFVAFHPLWISPDGAIFFTQSIDRG